MRKLLYIVIGLLTLCACSGVSPEWRAASEARDYYDCLTTGNVEDFMRGKAGIDSLPTAYREQLHEAMELYLSDVKAKHGGLREVRISQEHYLQDIEQCRDSALHLTYAFLILCFADSTQEEITIPMVEENGEWKMR